MRKALIALVMCAFTVSAVAATTTVSAKQAGASDIRQYDILFWMAGDRVVGKLTVNFATGHYIVNANYGKGGTKGEAKQEPAESGIIKAQNSNANP